MTTTMTLKPTMQAQSDKITRRKLSDQVLDRLKQMIATGELGAGDALPSERSLMDRFGVGRPAVREALQALHTNGLITISHGERSRVNVMDVSTVLSQGDAIARMILSSAPDNLDHLKSARRMFELGMIRESVGKVSSSDIKELREIIEQQSGHLSDPQAFVLADMKFHQRIADISKNPIISAVCQAMLRWLFEHHCTLLHWSGNEDVTLAEHSRIVDFLEARDIESATDEMGRHLDRSAAIFRSS